jgi:regulator of RNase E activity RraA
MAARGAVGLVTDGAMRDVEGIRQTGLPIWCSGICAPPSVAHLTFVDWQQPIGCGGVGIYPNDVMVTDRDGDVVPGAFVNAVVEAGHEAEALEVWILQKVLDGRRRPGLGPPDEATPAEYLEQKAKC